jgi:hypothetical protein
MKGGTQAAIALGIGYMLGRRKKLRRAAILAAVTATGSFGGVSKALLDRGLKAAGSSELLGKVTPQLGEIADTARTELLDAGKTAAMALVTNRVESFSDSLHSRADALRDPAGAGNGVVEKLRGGGSRKRRGRDEDEADESRSGRNGQDQDAYDDEYESDETGYADEDNYEDEGYAPEDDERGDEYEPEDEEDAGEEEPAPVKRRRTRVAASPVSRAGR